MATMVSLSLYLLVSIGSVDLPDWFRRDGGDDLAQRIADAGGADDYPGADCVIVLDESMVEVEPSGLATTDRRHVLKILRDGGIGREGVQQFDFDPVTNRYQVRSVRIHRAGGEVEAVDLSGINTLPASAWGIFWGSMLQTLALPRLAVNDCIEINTRMTGFNIAYLAAADTGSGESANTGLPSGPIVGAEHLEPPMPGHWHDTVYFQEGYPIIEKRYSVRIPRDKPLQYEVNHGQLRCSMRMDGDHLVYTWIGEDMPVLKREPRMVATSDAACKLTLATVPDWYAKSKWFHDANEHQFDSTPEIDAKVREIIAGIDDDIEKIRAINSWVADNIRYVGTSRGVCEGYTMHRSAETFRDRGGVCKDKAGMAVTMLRSAGLDAYPVMTQAGSFVEYTPADQFNHAVCCVRRPDGSLMLADPTWSPKSREIWSSREMYQPVIYGLPEGKDVDLSPYFPPEHNRATLTARSYVESDGRLETKIEWDLTGYPDTYFRRGIDREDADHQRGVIESWVSPIAPQTEVVLSNYTEPTDYADDVAGEVVVTAPRYAAGDAAMRVFKLPLMQHPFGDVFAGDVIEKVAEDKDRKYGLRLRTTRLLEYDERVDLPPGWRVASMPEAQSIDNEAASLSFEVEQEGASIRYRCRLAVKQQVIPARHYEDYRTVNDALRKLSDAYVVCRMEEERSTPVADAAATESKEVTR